MRYIVAIAGVFLQFSLVAFGGVAQSKEIRQVAANVPPFAMESATGNAGFLYEVVEAAHQRLGLAFHPDFVPFSRAQAETRERDDTLLVNIGRTPEREAQFRWIVLLHTPTVSVVQIGDAAPISSIESAKQLKTIGVLQDSAQLNFLKQADMKNLEPVPNDATNAKKLIAGRIDGWYTYDERVNYQLRQSGYQGKIVPGTAFQQVEIWLAGGPNFPADVADKLRQAVEQVRADGTYERIRAKYVN